MSLFKKFTLWQIGLLTATFAFGMAVNLFVPLPGDIGETAFWESGGSWLLRFHVLLALAILILAVLLLIKSRGLGRAAQRQSLGGFSSILLAIIMGIIFFFFGENDIFSFLMALGFVGALISYLLLPGLIAK